jgi:hypothetical protein
MEKGERAVIRVPEMGLPIRARAEHELSIRAVRNNVDFAGMTSEIVRHPRRAGTGLVEARVPQTGEAILPAVMTVRLSGLNAAFGLDRP